MYILLFIIGIIILPRRRVKELRPGLQMDTGKSLLATGMVALWLGCLASTSLPSVPRQFLF